MTYKERMQEKEIKDRWDGEQDLRIEIENKTNERANLINGNIKVDNVELENPPQILIRIGQCNANIHAGQLGSSLCLWLSPNEASVLRGKLGQVLDK